MQTRRFFLLLPALLLGAAAGRTTAQTGSTEKTDRYTRTIELNRAESPDNSSKTGSTLRVKYQLSPSFSERKELRLFKRETDSAFILEVEWQAHFSEVVRQLEKEFPTIRVPEDSLSIPAEERAKISAHNRKMREAIKSQYLKRRQIGQGSISVSQQLAEQLFETTKMEICRVLPIHTRRQIADSAFVGKFICDGEDATFQCISEEGMWKLWYIEPEGELRTLSELFQSMIEEVKMGTFDEMNYLDALDKW